MSKASIIALMSDFGNDDAYVASMKGKILSIAPKSHILDISHAISPQNIQQAAYVLWSTFKYFPKGTIFISVVDPGVGSSRKIICARGNGYIFLAPDNGILKYIFGAIHMNQIIEIKNKKYFNTDISSTFHGRDIFAPVAAYLAKGISVNKLGPKVKPKFGAENFIKVDLKKKLYKGIILHIDYFGNIITNFELKHIYRNMTLKFKRNTITLSAITYTNTQSSKPFMIIGSSGLLEISVKNGHAAKTLRAKINQSVDLNIL